jgi:hypothetical protein
MAGANGNALTWASDDPTAPSSQHPITSGTTASTLTTMDIPYHHAYSSTEEITPLSSYGTPATTPLTSGSSIPNDRDAVVRDFGKFIALGCLHLQRPIPLQDDPGKSVPDWVEMHFSTLPDEMKVLIGQDATRLLEANWIRAFLHCPESLDQPLDSIVRIYVLPEDWGRRFIDRKSKSLKAALRELLHRIDVSPESWSGDHLKAQQSRSSFDPWASAEKVSLFYLFNKLPSPAPSLENVKSRYSREAICALFDSVGSPSLGDSEGIAVNGLKTRLYPYQARSACVMVQRESAPQLQLDPRLETRLSPNGQSYYFGARDGSFLQEPRFYESNRGGILAETMVRQIEAMLNIY